MRFDQEANSFNQSRRNANLGFDTRLWKFRGNLRATWAGTRLLSVAGTGANAARREYLDDRLMFDCGLEFTATNRLTVFFNGRNITNEPQRTYVNRPDLSLRTAKFGATWALGVRAIF